MKNTPLCWIVTDGKTGMEVQAQGLAEALGLTPVIKRIQTRAPWRWLPPLLWRDPLRALSPTGDSLAPPWPDLVIASGRQSVAPALAIRRASRKRHPERPCYAIYIQNPKVSLARFDLIVTPSHDGLTGQNVITTLGSIHRVTAERLAAAGAQWQASVASLPKPLIAVLLGGDNKVYRFTSEIAAQLGQDLVALAKASGGTLLVTPSRRTGAENIALLQKRLQEVPHLFWDGTGQNPYYGYLALADRLIVTCDSVNMTTEAAATGKPVDVVFLKGGSAKFRRFHQEMQAQQLTRPFSGQLDAWIPPAFDEPSRVAASIRHSLPGLFDAE